MGKYSLAKGPLSALGHAKIGRDALLEAVKIDPTYHWAGPYRILGRYYQDLPKGISFGDKKKAREYFNKAIEVAPDFRVNLVYLATLETKHDSKLKILKLADAKPDLDGEIEELRYKKNLDIAFKALN